VKQLRIAALITVLLTGCAALCGAFAIALDQAEGRVSYWTAAAKAGVDDAEENLLRALALRAAAQMAVDRCKARLPGDAEYATQVGGLIVRLESCSGGITYTRSMPGAIGPPELIDFGEELAALGGPEAP
jgi:hypothetical protein